MQADQACNGCGYVKCACYELALQAWDKRVRKQVEQREADARNTAKAQ